MTILDRIKNYFLVTLAMILLVGIVMVYSSSYIYAKETFGSSTHFLFKHIFFLIFGSGVAFGLSKTKIKFWYKNSYNINIICIVLLLITFTPLGLTIKGSHRWINFLGLGFQPGEFIKYSVGLCAIQYFNNFDNYERNTKALYSLHFLIPLLMLLIQPDFGTFTITSLMILFACFMSGFSRKFFYGILSIGAAVGTSLLFIAPYRVKRLLVFLDPWADPQNSGFQIIQSYLAFANGHIFGAGIGNSNEKLFYLPEAYNDFIFSVMGEELGFIGIFIVITLFIALMFFGFKLALGVKSKNSAQIISSIVFLFSLQATLNMGVVLGLLPTKGLNLPFISYGGSSLFANMIGIGIIFSALNLKSNNFEKTEYNPERQGGF